MNGYDPTKIADAVLALLMATRCDDGRLSRRLPLEWLERLHDSGFISDPHGSGDSLYFTDEGLAYARDLAERLLAPDTRPAQR